MKTDFDVIIVGGGLAGLTSAIVLAKAKKQVLLIEKKIYPYHKVCGEYISNEVLEYLRGLGFDPFKYGASSINTLRISSPNGKNIYAPLDLGGFGISRFTMDDALCQLATNSGAAVLTNTRVTDVAFADEIFTVASNKTEVFTSKLVIGSYGKREMLDKKLERSFMNEHTGYIGVKYHIRTDYPEHEVGLDNFAGGYCGISKVDGDRFNLCYLFRRPAANIHKSIPELEAAILHRNPVLKRIFNESDFLFDAPEVINEIYFKPKTQIENHILMCGDTAGLITPLCGNGMSMAIAGAQLLTTLILKSELLEHQTTIPIRAKLEKEYQLEWNKRFSRRLFWGRTIQRFFGNPFLTNMTLGLLHSIPPLERKIIAATHGKPLI